MKLPRRTAASVATSQLRLAPLLAFAALGAGCAGYNHTLFVTKSNVGLDFDTQPPTTEITVARKEGVISPSFEQGKTPPVMASFQAQTGQGAAFKNFFFGVDQTFAGGDAALVMARLYDSPVAPDDLTKADYDSTLDIEKPTATAWWKKIPGPGITSPFLFATDTMFGLKISWSSAAQLPEAVKAGFNRKEFAWAPLSQSGETTDSAGSHPRVKVSSPAFLATVDSDTRTDGTAAKTGTLQYFATGKAAVYLASQPGVRSAMLARLDPSYHARLGAEVLGESLVLIQSVVSSRAESGDTLAQQHQAKLQALQGIALPADSLYRYALAADQKSFTQTDANAVNLSHIEGLITYNDLLESNRAQIAAATRALATGTLESYQPAGTPAPTAVIAKPAISDALLAAQGQNALHRDQFIRQLNANQDVANANMYVLGLILPR